MTLRIGNKKVCPTKIIAPRNQSKVITTNGVYVPDTGFTGFGDVTVDVPTGGNSYVLPSDADLATANSEMVSDCLVIKNSNSNVLGGVGFPIDNATLAEGDVLVFKFKVWWDDYFQYDKTIVSFLFNDSLRGCYDTFGGVTRFVGFGNNTVVNDGSSQAPYVMQDCRITITKASSGLQLLFESSTNGGQTYAIVNNYTWAEGTSATELVGVGFGRTNTVPGNTYLFKSMTWLSQTSLTLNGEKVRDFIEME